MADYILTALLVDEAWMKTKTPINGQVDVRLITPFIMVAQDLDLQPVLGTKLYQKLMAGVVGNTLSADETTLIEVCRPGLSYSTLARAIPFIGIEIRGAGVVRHVNEKVQPASVSEMNVLINSTNNIAEFYYERVKDYLCKNASKFPEYNSGTNPVYPERGSSFNGGVYYDDGCEKDCNLS